MKEDKKYCEHGHEIISRSEGSYFLKATAVKKQIINVLDYQGMIIDSTWRVLVLQSNFLNDDFRDLSISWNNLNCGVERKEDKNHKIYVWPDA